VSDHVPPPSAAALRTAVVAIVLVGAALRLAGLTTFPYEQDELYTRHEATYLFESRLRPGIEARPLYYLVQHALLLVAPAGPLALRVLPFLCGVLGIWITWRLGRRAFGTAAGLLAATFVAVNPWHLHASGFARYYAALYVLAAAAFLLLPRAYDGERPRDYIAALAVLVAGTLTHPSFVVPMIGVVVALTVVDRDGRVAWRWPSARGWRLLWGPYAAFLVVAYLALRLAAPEGALQNWGGRGTAATLRLVPAMVQWMTPVMFAAAAAGAALALAHPADGWRRHGAITLVGGLSTVGLLLLASTRTDVYADYGMALLPLVFVAAGGLFQWVVAPLGARAVPWLAAAAIVLVAGVAPSTVSHLRDGTRFDYRPAFAHIRAAAPTVAVLTEPIALQREYAPELRAYALRARTAYLDSALARERDLWVVTAVQRYGIVGDDGGALRRWLIEHCRLSATHERPRLDYRTYRVDLYRCGG
jgi:4-amino-4-deoxy-L-arabinose transferase-like glycosyltransferase